MEKWKRVNFFKKIFYFMVLNSIFALISPEYYGAANWRKKIKPASF